MNRSCFTSYSLKVKEVLYVRDQPLSSHMKDSSGKLFTTLMESASKTSEGFTAGFCYLTYTFFFNDSIQVEMKCIYLRLVAT